MNLDGVYQYVEVGAALPKDKFPNSKFGFMRKKYFEPNNLNEFIQQFENTDIYKTNMIYINPFWYQDTYKRWLISTEDTLKWGEFYLDFDYAIESSEDYDKIKEDALIAMRYLTLILKIPVEQIRIFFSGSKGIHITVSPITLGLEPHLKLHEIYKELMLDILRYTKHDTIDVKIYDDKRLFRIENSFNSKGGRFKIPITFDELQKWTYQDMLKNSLEPRIIKIHTPLKSAIAQNVLRAKIELWSKRAETEQVYSGKMKAIKELPPCINEMHTKVFRETLDERNNSASGLASFYMQKGLEIGQTMSILYKWNEENCKPSLKRNEIKIIVNSIYNGRYRYGCETFKRVSGVCDKENCSLFKPVEKKKDE